MGIYSHIKKKWNNFYFNWKGVILLKETYLFESKQVIKNNSPSIIIIEDSVHCYGSKISEDRLLVTTGDISFFSLEY